jgi:hypothetical protein
LIFNGIFIFHKYLRRNLVCPFIKSRYIDLTVKSPDSFRFHINLSGSGVRVTVINFCEVADKVVGVILFLGRRKGQCWG